MSSSLKPFFNKSVLTFSGPFKERLIFSFIYDFMSKIVQIVDNFYFSFNFPFILRAVQELQVLREPAVHELPEPAVQELLAVHRLREPAAGLRQIREHC